MRICVVDDDSPAEGLLTRMIRHHLPGAEVDFLRSYDAALAAVHGWQTATSPMPDGVILDLLLPVEDHAGTLEWTPGAPGLDLLKRLRANEATALLPVVVRTGMPSQLDLVPVAPMTERYAKGDDPGDLIESLRSMMASRGVVLPPPVAARRLERLRQPENVILRVAAVAAALTAVGAIAVRLASLLF